MKLSTIFLATTLLSSGLATASSWPSPHPVYANLNVINHTSKTISDTTKAIRDGVMDHSSKTIPPGKTFFQAKNSDYVGAGFKIIIGSNAPLAGQCTATVYTSGITPFSGGNGSQGFVCSRSGNTLTINSTSSTKEAS